MKTYKAVSLARKVHRVNRAIAAPHLATKSLVKRKALGAVGFWRLMNKFWRL